MRQIIVPLCDLRAQYLLLKKEIDSAVSSVLHRGDYVMGGEVLQFEGEWAEYCKAKYCVGVSSGTDALYLALKSLLELGTLKEHDKVITTPATFFATVQSIVAAGLDPVFMEIEEDFNIDLSKRPKGPKSVASALLPVNLYGRPALVPNVVDSIEPVVEDSAQAHGIGHRSTLSCWSFYPTKNLGAMGQAGAVVTNDMGLADSIRELRTYGERERFVHYSTTGNHRMDEIQAAILRVKLPHLDEWNQLRRERASWYREELKGIDKVLLPEDHPQHVYHAYVVRLKERKGLADFLAKHGIQTAVRYPVPMHLQPALSCLGYKRGDFPQAEAWADENLNLPMYPELTREQVEYVCGRVHEWAEADRVGG